MKPKAAKAKSVADAHHGARPGGHKKVFDVTRPGKTPAAATSRPVIVGHKTIQHDINGISAPKEKETAKEQDLLDAKHKVTVQPAGAFNTKVTVTAKAPGSTQAAAATSLPASSEVAAPLSPAPTSPPAQQSHTVSREEEIIDLGELALGIDPPPITQEPPAPPSDAVLAAAARALDKTVGDSAAPHMPQTIVVSHHHPRMEWGKFVLILLLVAVLGLVVFNFLLDLNILDERSPLPHTDFFQR